MKDLSIFLTGNIAMAITFEEERKSEYSKGRIKAYKTVLELIRIYEEDIKL